MFFMYENNLNFLWRFVENNFYDIKLHNKLTFISTHKIDTSMYKINTSTSEIKQHTFCNSSTQLYRKVLIPTLYHQKINSWWHHTLWMPCNKVYPNTLNINNRIKQFHNMLQFIQNNKNLFMIWKWPSKGIWMD
jgi:hypothetical protein